MTAGPDLEQVFVLADVTETAVRDVLTVLAFWLGVELPEVEVAEVVRELRVEAAKLGGVA